MIATSSVAGGGGDGGAVFVPAAAPAAAVVVLVSLLLLATVMSRAHELAWRAKFCVKYPLFLLEFSCRLPQGSGGSAPHSPFHVRAYNTVCLRSCSAREKEGRRGARPRQSENKPSTVSSFLLLAGGRGRGRKKGRC